MADQDDNRGGSSGAVRPGALSALLQEIAAAPAPAGEGWDSGLRPGAVVGRFELVRELGRGGFGVVWEARDRELGRRVAFKAVRAGARRDLREERLLSEAEAAARLSHPNLVTLFDVGRTEHGPFLVLELLDGETVADRLRNGPLRPGEALRIGVEAAKGVAHAHAQGVAHRDLKPENVFLCRDGQVKVLDFGLAHAFGRRRQEGGTSGYMAPEQVEGAPEDERTDVWALGAMLFEMLSGKRPFEDEKALRRPAPALEVPGAPALGPLVARMLSLRPVDRPRDGGEVLRALEKATAEPPRLATGTVRTRRRPRLGLAGLIALGVIAAVAIAGAVTRWRTSRTPAPGADGRVVVAVADLANETGDPELDGLSGLLTTSLDQSRKLRVLTRARMGRLLGQAGKGGAQRIGEEQALEAGRKAGARAVLLGSVRRIGEAYLAELRALDPKRDEYLFTLRDQAATKSDLLPLVDRLSDRTRQRLGEPAAEVKASEVRVADTVTPSLEAYRHYFLGEDCLERTSPVAKACAAHFERAVEADRSFALAWFQLAYARHWGLLGRAREAMQEALRLVDRAPPKEQLQIRAFAAQLEGRDEEASALFPQAARASPDDRLVQSQAADFFATRNDLAGALPYLRAAVALDPTGTTSDRQYLAIALGALARRDELAALARETERLPASPEKWLGLAWAHAWLGDRSRAIEEARRAEAAFDRRDGATDAWNRNLRVVLEDPAVERDLLSKVRADPGLRLPLSLLRATQGRRREALASLDALPRERLFHLWRAEFLVGDGDPEAVWREARLAAAVTPEFAPNLAVHLAYLGTLSRAAELATGLSPGSPRERVYRAVVQWKQGARAEALAELRALSAANPWSTDVPVLPPSFLLGELAAEMGEDATAVEALRRFQSLVVLNPYWGWAWPRSLLLLAGAQARLGQRDEAMATLKRLLDLLKRADPGLPLLGEARALRSRLATAPGPANHGTR